MVRLSYGSKKALVREQEETLEVFVKSTGFCPAGTEAG
jgi:hypothetical protein